MRKSTKSELRMSREFLHFLLPRVGCYFCKQPLIEQRVERFANSDQPPLKDVKITIHHENGTHRDNTILGIIVKKGLLFFKGNAHPAHRNCHRSFHMKERMAAKKLAPRKDEAQ